MSFTPCVGDAATIQKIMDVNAMEVLMTDEACGDDIEAAGRARRQSLWNSCLDFVLMMGDGEPILGLKGKENQDEMGEKLRDDDKGQSNGTKDGPVDELEIEQTEAQPLHLNPNVALCPYELGGVCADPYCPYQHLAAKGNRPKIVPREMLPLPPLKLPDDPVALEEQIMMDVENSVKDQGDEDSNRNTVSAEEEDKENKANAEESTSPTRIEDEESKATSQPVESNISLEAVTISQGGDESFARDGEETKIVDSSEVKVCGSKAKDFEANLDFIPFDMAEDDYDKGEGGQAIDEDFLNLETAGLVGLEKFVESQEKIDDNTKLFWWQSTATGKRTGFLPIEGWLRLYGDFHVVQRDKSSGAEASLQYRGSKAIDTCALCSFATRTVDCAQMLVHTGRFDLTEPVCLILKDVVKEATGNNSVHMAEFFREAFKVTSAAVDFAYCNQNGFRSTFYCQVVLAMISDFLFAVHTQVSASIDDPVMWEKCGTHIKKLSKLLTGFDTSSFTVDEEHSQSAWYIRESIKLELFRRGRYEQHNSSSDATHCGVAESMSLLGDTGKAVGFAAAIRSNFSVVSVSEDFVNPIWSLVKSSFDPRREPEKSNPSTSYLRSCIYLCFMLFGVLEGAVDYLKEVRCDPNQLASVAFSALIQLDGTVHGILKSLNRLTATKAKLPLFSLLLTPIMGASVAFASHLGFYAKAQHRLELCLSAAAITNDMLYSEILWSQLVHLRSTLPLSQNASDSKTEHQVLSKRHNKVASKVSRYGVFLHHLCLQGDWSLLMHLNTLGSTLAVNDARDATAKPNKEEFFALRRNAVSVRMHTNNTFLQAPVSVRGIKPVVHGEFTAGFPRSFLVYGRNIKYLSLVCCQLHELPHSLGLHFPNLKSLDLSRNNLECLPESLGALSNLETLALNNNRLRGLPQSFGKLTSLRKLLLCNNYLDSFPPLLKELKQLEDLQLRGNDFDVVDSAQLTLLLPKLRVFTT